MKLFHRKAKEPSTFLYDEEELNQYEQYIMEQFGEYQQVFHEVVSPDIHLDIIIVPPTEKNNYYQLITMGMGAYPMNVPEELKNKNLERAELVLYLPPTWNISSAKEEDYWPIRQLKTIARLPIYNHTWLGYGHTISSDEENSCYASNTKFCSMMLVTALNRDNQPLDLKMDHLGKINFYQLFPLYPEELEYKMAHGADSLLDLFDEEALLGVVDCDRKNFCA
ncbi:MAG TPA: suppressor of fused domain protein [Candidatus Scybalousia intestinigallinarum]|nr:suppressor of fused domain protein [Candidatus Scybalousia intestinigallinarum]